MNLVNTPISHDYEIPSESFVNFLKEKSNRKSFLDIPRIEYLNTYEAIELNEPGHGCDVLREAVVIQLEKVLEILPAEYEIWIFDGFRSVQTQKRLFDMIFNQQKDLYPGKHHEELYEITKQFVADPSSRGHFPVPPHNSGGAVDLTLAKNDELLDMGTDFDEVSPLAETTYFEKSWDSSTLIDEKRWLHIRENRRLLFHVLKQVGFVNYRNEWWHYDLGDCIWSRTVYPDWFYDSME